MFPGTNPQSPIEYQTRRRWLHLRLINYYRGALALFFLTVYLNGWADLLFSSNYRAPVFMWATIAYIAVCIISMATLSWNRPGISAQAAIQLGLDILILTALVHACGGTRTGLGMLLIINVSAASLFYPRTIAYLFAAFASLAILGEQLYSAYHYPGYLPSFTQAGILGLLFFTAAHFTSIIFDKITQSEAYANQQSLELESVVQMNEHIIQHMRTGIMVVSPKGEIYMANSAATSLLGEVRITRNSTLANTLPSLYTAFNHWKEQPNQPQNAIHQSLGLPDLQPGFSIIEPHKGANSRVLIFLEDASQLNQRFQQVRLASLGRLTASIAHEIRNPLAAINHAAQLLAESHAGSDDEKLTGIINTQVERLDTMVENILQLSRQQKGTPQELALNHWMTGFRSEFCSSNNLATEQVRIDVPDDITIRFDADHLHQVMWNLCTNAMTHAGVAPGDLFISVEGGYSEEQERPYITFHDNGVGIPEEIENNIFDPFYTTHRSGTGLGLYIAREVIESNRAKIQLRRQEGGTHFIIYFLAA